MYERNGRETIIDNAGTFWLNEEHKNIKICEKLQ